MKTSREWLRQSEATDAYAATLEAEADAIASGRHPEWRHQDIRAEAARWRLEMAADYRRWAAAERDIARRVAALEAEEAMRAAQ